MAWTMRLMRLVGHRVRRRMRQVFSWAEARSPGARSLVWMRLYGW